MTAIVPNKGHLSGRAVGWCGEKALAIDMCAMLIANDFPATIRKIVNTYNGHHSPSFCWAIDVVDLRHRERARELIRGFRAALPVRGQPAAFVQGVVSGFYYKYKTEPEKLKPLQNSKQLGAAHPEQERDK